MTCLLIFKTIIFRVPFPNCKIGCLSPETVIAKKLKVKFSKMIYFSCRYNTNTKNKKKILRIQYNKSVFFVFFCLVLKMLTDRQFKFSQNIYLYVTLQKKIVVIISKVLVTLNQYIFIILIIIAEYDLNLSVTKIYSLLIYTFTEVICEKLKNVLF